MATRLNSDIRHEIVKNAIKAQFDPRFDALLVDEYALAVTVYETVLPQDLREALAVIGKYHVKGPQFVQISTGAKPSVYPHTHMLDYVAVHTAQGFNILLPAPKDMVKIYSGALTLNDKNDKGRKLSEAVSAISERRTKLKQARVDAEKALEQSLRRVTTLEKLCEQWPEGKKFYQSPPLAKPIALPVIRFAEVNAMLGLGA